MTAFVVDASAVGAYLLPDEDSDLLPGLTEALAEWLLIVPPHWQFEVANLSLVAVRRGRLTAAQLPGLAESVRALQVEVDPLGGADAWDTVLTMALGHDLSIYDAAYLALARRRELPLATLDAKLSAAARHERVALLGR